MMGTRKTKREFLTELGAMEKPKMIGHNTLEYYQGNERRVRFHETDIITYHNDGTISLNTGGWYTPTTKARINAHITHPFYVYQERGRWFLTNRETGAVSFFYDGITFNAETGEILNPQSDDNAETKRIEKLIKAYCKALKELETLPTPDNGDCWYCLMKEVKTGRPLGEITENKDHLITHLEEKYIHGSLIVNALIWAGYRFPEVIYSLDNRTSVISAVRRYFKAQLRMVR